MSSRQTETAAQDARATAAGLLQTQVAAAAAALGNLTEQAAAAPAEGADVVVAAVDADLRARDVQSDAAVVSDAAPAPSASADAPVLLAQAAQSESDRKAAAVPASGGNSDKKDDDKGAAVVKDDDDKGGMWGWLGGLGLLAAAAGGGGGGSSAPAPGPAPAPAPLPEVLGGNGTALQENQSNDIFKANGAGSVPIQGGAFTGGMIIDIANDTGFALEELTYYAFNSTSGGVALNGTFTLVAGVANYVTTEGTTILSEMDYTPTSWGSTTLVGTDDIMVMWDGSASTNANYGYVLENVKINDTFTVEGLTFKYEGSGVISVITA